MQSRTSKIQKKTWSFEDYIQSLARQLDEGIQKQQLLAKEDRERVFASSRLSYIESLGFQPFEWQKRILNSKSRRLAIDASRQAGKSTIISSLPCHIAKYKPGSLSIVAAATEDQAREDKNDKILGFMSMDPDYPQLVRDSDKQIELDNGSRIIVVPATDKSARGYSKPDLVILDEASRIENIVYNSAIRPMFTNNPTGILVMLSTPNGKEGFFHDIFTRQDATWERYLIRTIWEPIMTGNGPDLVKYMDLEAFRAEQAAKGVYADYSPRHMSYEERLEDLMDMGERLFRQEFCGEFVETEDSVFTYEDIDRLFNSKAQGLTEGINAAPAASIDFGGFLS